MKFATIELNTGHVIEEHDFSGDDYRSRIDLFRKYILPPLKALYQRPHKKAFHEVSGRRITAWSRQLNYVGGHKERVVMIRFSWDTNQNFTEWMLRLGMTRYEWLAGRKSCPWVIYQEGVYYIHLSEAAWAFVAGDDGNLLPRE
jgi:hypothetical protein